MHPTAVWLARAATLALSLAATPVLAESVVTVAMTAGDIPDWTGAPNQGYEGMRFTGYTLYDALVNWDLSKPDVAADIAPGLATEWHIDPNDSKKWIFKLREGVSFHDGCAWNADAALWNFARVKDKASKQFNPNHAAIMGNAVLNVASVEKVDDSTIAITTTIVDSLLPYEISVFVQVSPCAVEEDGYDYAKFADHPAGTGPYMFDKVTPHQSLELVRNPNYWDAARVPKHDRLVLMPMPEAATRAAALLAGQVNFVEAPAPDSIDRLKSAGMQIVTAPYPHNWNYEIRNDSGPFADVRVRQAANYAINRDDIVTLLSGTATPGYGFFINSQPFYGNPVSYAYDPEKAKALLTEAGCMPCEITVAISTSGSGQMQPLPMNELVKEQLEAVGFKVTLETLDWNVLGGEVFGAGAAKYPDYDAINVSLPALDPTQLLKAVMTQYQSPNGGWNWGNYSNAEVDKMGEEVMATFDDEARNALITKLHEQVVGAAASIFIVHDLNPRALSPKLKGFVQAQSWFQDLTPITVEP